MALYIDSVARECKPPEWVFWQRSDSMRCQISGKTIALCDAWEQTQRNLQVQLADHYQLLKLGEAILSEALFGKQMKTSWGPSIKCTRQNQQTATAQRSAKVHTSLPCWALFAQGFCVTFLRGTADSGVKYLQNKQPISAKRRWIMYPKHS